MKEYAVSDGTFRVYSDISWQQGNCGYAYSILWDGQPFGRHSGRLLKSGFTTAAELATVAIALRGCPDGANVIVSCDVADFPSLICTPRPSKLSIAVELVRAETERFSSCRFLVDREHPEYRWCHRRSAIARKRGVTASAWRVRRNPPRLIRCVPNGQIVVVQTAD